MRKLRIPSSEITLSTADSKPLTVLCAILVVSIESNTLLASLTLVSLNTLLMSLVQSQETVSLSKTPNRWSLVAKDMAYETMTCWMDQGHEELNPGVTAFGKSLWEVLDSLGIWASQCP